MKLKVRVHTPMYDYNDKKYIRFLVAEPAARNVQRIHLDKAFLIQNAHIDDPLDGNILTVKVPFRYRRVMCSVEGKPVQSLEVGDEAEVVIDYKGVWNVGNYSGYSWVLNSLKY